MSKIITKIGDIYSVNIDDKYKKYIQYVANDLLQLNSDVIRAFNRSYEINEDPDLTLIVKDEVDFYAHCILDIGLNLGYWNKIGNISDVGDFNRIIFRDTVDYGHKFGEEPKKLSFNWHVWKIKDKSFLKVGRLEEKYKNSFIGLVINPLGIIEMLKGHKYPINYPDFE
ncbi:MAG: hypothetical protein HZB41_14905 [Ignavibacteriae bacterium]|nr:hypothetical protein [Ignavibacteriota bacterium]